MIEFEGTPKLVTLEEIINKPSWDSVDIEFLVEHQDYLDDDVLAKLGIVEIKPLTEEEVKVETEKIKKRVRATIK